jgi:two-component system, NarL family, sensor kinase
MPAVPTLRRWSRAAAAAVGGVCAGLAVATVLLLAVSPEPAYSGGDAWRGVAAGAGYGLLGALVVRHGRGGRPGAVGWVMLVAGTAAAVSAATGLLAHRLLVADAGDSIGSTLFWVSSWAWVPGYTLPPTLLLLLLPTGRLPGPRWCPVAAVATTVTVVATVGWALTPYGEQDVPVPAFYGPLVNPVGVAGAWTVVAVSLPVLAVCAVAALASLTVRLRRSSGIERDRTAYVLTGAVLAAVLLVAAWVLPGAADVLLALATLPLPVAVAWAVVRHRLWDLDTVLNRALLYAALTGATLALHALVLALLTVLLGDVVRGGSLVVFVLSALAVQPLRDWLQRLVNRLLYGQADDPGAAVSRLGGRLQQATSDPLPGVVEVVARTLRSPHVVLEVPGRPPVSLGSPRQQEVQPDMHRDTGGDVEHVALVYSGRPVGRLSVTVPPGGLGTRGHRLLTELARHAAVAAHATRLADELRSSRERVVGSREEERRRLRHDLHDDLGPGLAATAMQLEAAGELVESAPDRARAALDDAARFLRSSVADVRRIVDDLRPAALDDLGLLEAVDGLAERLRSGGMAVTVEGAGPLESLPAATEVAAFRIVGEALANVSRHARASRAEVRLEHDGRRLLLSVADDGQGVTAGAPAGVGLGSMHARAAELGGTCTVAGRPGEGTTVTAELPVELLLEVADPRPAAPAPETPWGPAA